MANSPRRSVRVLLVAGTLLMTACTATESGQPSSPPFDSQVREDNKDPSVRIPDIVIVSYEGAVHADPGQRVAYDKSPPFGGAHDQIWADCTGIIYDQAVRNEHMVHALEHGTVWIAYHPDEIRGDALDTLKAKVEGQPYLMLSPYPDLDRPISLQSWGHQLKLDSADDQRIDQFIRSLRVNEYQSPEPGARCDPADPTVFDVTDPPPFEPGPPGPDAMPVSPR